MRGVVDDLSEVELSAIEAAVGSTSFKRGRSYANNNRVLKLEWDPEIDTLLGKVVGHGGLYDTAAFFAAGDAGALRFADGECTCPVGYNCKHVAAIVIAATPQGAPGRRSSGRPNGRSTITAPPPPPTLDSAIVHPQPPGTALPAPPPPPSWELSLRALINAPAAAATGNPLAIALDLREAGPNGRSALQLLARLMRPGARGGWDQRLAHLERTGPVPVSRRRASGGSPGPRARALCRAWRTEEARELPLRRAEDARPGHVRQPAAMVGAGRRAAAWAATDPRAGRPRRGELLPGRACARRDGCGQRGISRARVAAAGRRRRRQLGAAPVHRLDRPRYRLRRASRYRCGCAGRSLPVGARAPH